MNFGLYKDFHLTERRKPEFRMEAFNFLNKTNFNAPNCNRSADNLGSLTGAQAARDIQFALLSVALPASLRQSLTRARAELRTSRRA
ncbi:MAG: hypothetical protein ACKV2U_17910 [Bryobacteraceae bacterium]